MIGYTFSSDVPGRRSRRDPSRGRPRTAEDERSRQRDAFASVLAVGDLARSAGVLASRMDSLRRESRPEDAARLLRKSLIKQPSLAVGLIATLHAAGRPGEIDRVLDAACGLEVEYCGRIVIALEQSGLASYVPVLLARVEEQKLFELAAWAASEGLSTDSASALNPLISAVLACPTGRVVACAGRWRDAHREQAAADLLGTLVRARPPAVLTAVDQLIADQLIREAAELAVSYVEQATPDDAASLFTAVVESLPALAEPTMLALVERADVYEVLLEFRSALPPEIADACLGDIVRLLTSDQLVGLCARLHRYEQPDILGIVIARCVEQVDAVHLTESLHGAGLHDVAYRLTELTGQFDRLYLTRRVVSGRAW
jgi:hypothetical protein